MYRREAGTVATGHGEKLNDLNWRAIAAKQTRGFDMRDNISLSHRRAWHHGGGKTSCQQVAPGYQLGDGMYVCFHDVSIVEQENWGNVVYAVARNYFAMGARPVPGLSLFCIVVSIAIMTIGAIADYKLASTSI